MRRRRRYRNGWNRWHEDRRAGGRSGVPAKWALIALMALAGLIVIASIVS
jgi:hypothetical protein